MKNVSRGAIRYVALYGGLWLLGLGIAHVVEWWGSFALGH